MRKIQQFLPIGVALIASLAVAGSAQAETAAGKADYKAFLSTAHMMNSLNSKSVLASGKRVEKQLMPCLKTAVSGINKAYGTSTADQKKAQTATLDAAIEADEQVIFKGGLGKQKLKLLAKNTETLASGLSDTKYAKTEKASVALDKKLLTVNTCADMKAWKAHGYSLSKLPAGTAAIAKTTTNATITATKKLIDAAGMTAKQENTALAKVKQGAKHFAGAIKKLVAAFQKAAGNL